ncbi:MAG: DUF2190 family protein [Victivallales bacterium]|nr:DUF2190 family protein [Victivallales bacterium]
MSRTATYVQQGTRINYTAGSDIAAGTPVKIANGLYGIADRDIANGETGALTIEGVYRFTAAGAITTGTPVYLSSGKVTSSAGEGTCIGVALEAATQDGDEILVKLNTLPLAPAAAAASNATT